MESELNRLLTAMLVIAQNNLASQDGFAPFALLLLADSDSVQFAHRDTPGEDAATALEAIQKWLKEQSLTGKYRAVGCCAQAEIELQSPTRVVQSIFASLEHASGEAFEAHIPYEKTDSYTYHDRIVLPQQPTMFGSSGASPA
jgi:hypothetical protein